MRGALSPGIRLANHYQIEKVIGGGGFGITYVGLDVRTMSQVCIKELFIHKQSIRHEDGSVMVTSDESDRSFFLDRFIREARSLATFQHFNVVRVEDFFEDLGTAYYVMEYVDGMTLAEHVKDCGVLEPGQLRHIFRQLMEAIGAIHDMGLLHRDIKPSNVMLEPGLRVKLIDFGAAKDPKIQAKSGHTVVITDGFAPLEQYSAEGNIGAHSDIYSLGATMLFALTGERPMPATSSQNRLLQAAELHPDLVALLEYFMGSQPEDRPISMASASAEFEQTMSVVLADAKDEKTSEPEAISEEVQESEENVEVEFAGTLSRMAGLARGVVLLMVGLIVLDVLAIYFSLISYDILTEWRDGFGFDSIRMGELEDAGLLVDLAYLLLQIPLIIVFLAWLLRLHRLAAAVQETGFSQNQVVWSWLVPILSWFRPFIIMKKCMLSLSSVENISRGLWMLRMWWVFWLLRSAGSSWVVQRSLAIDNEWASSGMRLDFLNEYFLYMFFEVSAAVFLILVTLKCTKLAQSQFASTSRVS